jgi:adenosylhomocysteinase
LAEGRLLNLSAAEGHPASVMDMSFATQALASEFAVKQHNLEIKVHNVPERIEQHVATLKLKTMGIKIDKLTPMQKAYLAECGEGT